MKNQEEIYFDNGCTFMDRGKYQLAIIEFTKAINLEPNEFGASYENRAVAKCFLGDFGSAIPDYLKAISICKTALLNPNENYKQICIDLSFSLYNLASCQTRMCNYKTALLNLEESLSYFPYNEPNLAGVSMDEINTMISINKKIEAAIEILDKETLEYIHKCDVKMDPRVSEEMVLQTIKDIALQSNNETKKRAIELWKPIVWEELTKDQKHELEPCTIMISNEYVNAIMEDFKPQIKLYSELKNIGNV